MKKGKKVQGKSKQINSIYELNIPKDEEEVKKKKNKEEKKKKPKEAKEPKEPKDKTVQTLEEACSGVCQCFLRKYLR